MKNKSSIKKLDKKTIKKAKNLIKKLDLKTNLKTKIEPIFDEIYFKGLDSLNKK